LGAIAAPCFITLHIAAAAFTVHHHNPNTTQRHLRWPTKCRERKEKWGEEEGWAVLPFISGSFFPSCVTSTLGEKLVEEFFLVNLYTRSRESSRSGNVRRRRALGRPEEPGQESSLDAAGPNLHILPSEKELGCRAVTLMQSAQQRR